FTLLFPLMFLVVFGLLFRDSTISKSNIIEVGSVPVLDQITGEGRAGVDSVLTIQHSDDLASALEKVRKGDADAAVEQQGSNVTLHYSMADRVKAATVTAVMNDLVQGVNLDGVPLKYELSAEQVEDKSLKPIQYLTPGILGWAIASGATFGAAL